VHFTDHTRHYKSRTNTYNSIKHPDIAVLRQGRSARLLKVNGDSYTCENSDRKQISFRIYGLNYLKMVSNLAMLKNSSQNLDLDLDADDFQNSKLVKLITFL